MAQSWGGTHSAGSWHYRDSLHPSKPRAGDGCAVDFGDANSDCQAIYDLLVPHARSAVIVELIWQHTVWRSGRSSRYALSDHMDHVHAAIGSRAQLPT